MKERLQQLQQEALEKIEQANDLKALNDVRVAYLGKKGPITEVLRGMGALSPEERPLMGALVNDVREAIQRALEKYLPGLGVLFEALWNHATDEQKQSMLETLEEAVKK